MKTISDLWKFPMKTFYVKQRKKEVLKINTSFLMRHRGFEPRTT